MAHGCKGMACLGLLGLALLLTGCPSPKTPEPDAPNPEAVIKHRLPWREPRRAPDVLAFFPDGTALAVVEWHGRLFDLGTGQERPEDKETLRNLSSQYLAFSPDGTRLASVANGGMLGEPRGYVHLCEVTADKQIRRIGTLAKFPELVSTTPTFHAAFSSDGKRLTAGDQDGTVYVWDAVTGKEQLRVPGGVAAAFSPDGKVLITVRFDGEVCRWDAITGQPLMPDRRAGPRSFIAALGVAFAP